MDKFILELPNAVPIELCNEIIERFKNDDRKRKGKCVYMGKILSQEITEQMKPTLELSLGYETPGWEDIEKKMIYHMFKSAETYFKYLKDNFNFSQKIHALYPYIPDNEIYIPDLLIQNIKEGDEYRWHVDMADSLGMFCNVLVYLNTIENGQGGETEFPNGRKVRPECGKILLFPSLWSFPHRSTKLIEGNKYTCTGNIFRKLSN